MKGTVGFLHWICPEPSDRNASAGICTEQEIDLKTPNGSIEFCPSVMQQKMHTGYINDLFSSVARSMAHLIIITLSFFQMATQNISTILLLFSIIFSHKKRILEGGEKQNSTSWIRSLTTKVSTVTSWIGDH